MKNVILFLILCICVIIKQSEAQYNLIDPYIIYTGSGLINYPTYENSQNEEIENSHNDNGPNNGYTGEYMINLQNLPAYFVTPNPNNPSLQFDFKYEIELVSYPFTINCFDQAGGCASYTTDPVHPVPIYSRELYMPDDAYSSQTLSWSNLKNKRIDGYFENYGNSYISAYSNTNPEALVSTFFHIKNNSFVNDRNYMPHSVLKMTVFVLCKNTVTPTIIDSYSWIYDNTRGRMRYYPFLNDNTPVTGTPQNWDVMFAPSFIGPFESSIDYGNTNNDTWIDGGTINYFPFKDDSNDPCNPATIYFPPNQQPDFRTWMPGYEYSHGYPAPFGLMSTFLRDGNSKNLAGYSESPAGGQISVDINSVGLKHSYFIDKGFPDIDLTVINSLDKVIYNPSEVSVIADQNTQQLTTLIFPTNYTFKTILGRYPSYQQVIDAQNDLQNDAAGLDLKDVPVPSTAGTGTTNDPEVSWDDPSTAINEKLGYYSIENNAMIRVEPCVHIFDAEFKVKSGGTLWFEDHTSIKGNEDKSTNFGRYKIKGTGGAVLRNYDAVQYVQNGDITQTYPLEYLATDIIEAGSNVDTDGDAAQGNYVLNNGSDVTFIAGDYIHLTDGFDATSGSSFSAYTQTVTAPTCNFFAANGGTSQNRFFSSDIVSNTNAKISVSPNPVKDLLTVSTLNFNAHKNCIIVDAMGKEVYRSENQISNSISVLIEKFVGGIYFVIISDTNGNTATSKFVKQ